MISKPSKNTSFENIKVGDKVAPKLVCLITYWLLCFFAGRVAAMIAYPDVFLTVLLVIGGWSGITYIARDLIAKLDRDAKLAKDAR